MKRTTTSYREGQLNLKQFYLIPYEEKKKYIQFLLELDTSARSELDEYILQHFHRNSDTGAKVKFFQLEDS